MPLHNIWFDERRIVASTAISYHNQETLILIDSQSNGGTAYRRVFHHIDQQFAHTCIEQDGLILRNRQRFHIEAEIDRQTMLSHMPGKPADRRR